MNRKTQIALAVFGVLSLLTIIALRRPETGERVGERPRPVPRFKTGDFDTIAVTKAGKTAVVRKAGDKYSVIQPVSYPADEPGAKQAFEAIEKMEFSDIVTDKKEKQAEFEVDDAKGFRLAIKKGDKVLGDLIVGKSLGAGTMVRPSGKDEIWLMSAFSKYAFDKGPADWRDKSITTFTATDAEKIEIKSKAGERIVVKKTDKKEGSEDQWAVVESSVRVDKMDHSIPNGIVSTMAALKTNDFADGSSLSPEQAGLTTPELTVSVGLKGGKTATVLVGNKQGEEDWYVKSGDAPQVYLVKKPTIERVNKRPVEFRDKVVCNIADTELTTLAVTHGAESYALVKDPKDSSWKATKPPKLEADSSKVTNVVGGFKDLKATSFAPDSSPKATGLAKPKATIVAKGKAASCSLKVGDETKDKQSYNVQSGAGPDVYLVGKWAIDRILVKVDDLKKSGHGLAHK